MADKEHVLTEKLLQMPSRNMKKLGADAERWDGSTSLDRYLAELEKELIREAMIKKGGNITKAAAALNIKRQTLQHKLKKYGIQEG